LRLITTITASQAHANQRNTATPLTNPWTSESSRSASTRSVSGAAADGRRSQPVAILEAPVIRDICAQSALVRPAARRRPRLAFPLTSTMVEVSWMAE
jgi:hypothetical protein